MNARERFLQTMCFGPCDRIPYYELGMWKSTVDGWYEKGLPEDVPVDRVADYFGFDRVREDVGVNFEMVPPYRERIIEEKEDRKIVLSSDGIKKEILKGKPETSMPHFIEFPVRNRKDFEDLKKRYRPDCPWRYPAWWEDKVCSWKQRDYPLRIGGFGPFWMLRKWMGFEKMLTLFHDDPGLVQGMVEFWTDFYVETMKRALKDVDVDWACIPEDMAFKTASMISPAMFRKFLMPAYRKITDILHQHGVKVIFVDSDGNINELIPLWLEVGVNGVLPLEVAAGMDPVALRKRYGQDLLMMGGIDKRVLAKDKKAIEKEVVPKVSFLIEEGGYIPMVDHTVPPDVSLENFLYYRQLVRDLAER